MGSDDYPTTSSEETTSTLLSYSITWSWRESLLVIPLGLIVIGTILGNLLVLYSAITHRQKLRLPTHYFIANLALADFLVGVLVLPFLATLQVTGRWYLGSVYCEMWTLIHFWLCAASILSTCAVCVERYVGVRYPLRHKDIMSKRKIAGMIFIVWTLAGILATASLYIWPEPKSEDPLVCKINQQIGHVILAVVGILYVPAAIMMVLYWRIYMIAVKHLKFVKRQSVPLNKKTPGGIAVIGPDSSTSETSFNSSSATWTESDGKSGQGDKKKDSATSTTASPSAFSSDDSRTSLPVTNAQKQQQINLATRLSILVGVLLASYLPFFTLYMVMAFHPGSVNPHVFNAFGWIRYFNSCLNPFIYAFVVPAYRKAMRDAVRSIIK